MERQEGYYWIKWVGEWVIAEYRGAHWNLFGYDSSWHDSDIKEIDERRIERQPVRPSAEEIARKTEALRVSQSMGDRINDIDDMFTK